MTLDLDELKRVAEAASPLHSFTTKTVLALIKRVEDAETARVPEGWKLVPVEPTERMQVRGYTAMAPETAEHVDTEAVYRAMLAAAPSLKDHTNEHS